MNDRVETIVAVEVKESSRVVGEVALVVAPGTVAKTRDAAIDRALSECLHDAANELGVILSAAPHAYVTPRPGKDDHGRVVFDVRGFVEGDRLVPARPARPRGA